MSIDIFLCLVVIFGLATVFKNTYWLRIPVGIFLFVVGATAKSAFGLTGLVVYVGVCALPFILNKANPLPKILKTLLGKRARKPVKLKYEGFWWGSLGREAKECVSDSGYIATSSEATVKDITFEPSKGVKTEIRVQAYFQRSFFITAIFFVFIIWGNGIFPAINAKAFIYEHITDSFIISLALVASIIGTVFLIENALLFDEGELDKYIKEVGIKFKKERYNELLEKAEKERDLLAQKEAQEQKEAKQIELDIQAEKTKQAEIEAEIEREKIRKERPQKMRDLSSIKDKLDEL